MTDVIRANGWKVFMVLVAVLTALGSHLGAFPWLPAWAQHTIEFCSFVASVIVAVLIDPTKVVPPPTITEIRSGSAKIGCLVTAVLGAGLLVSSCASAPIVNAVNAEHIAVTAVHAVIQTEAQAFRAGAYDNAHHQTYVAALLKVTAAEKALNDALIGWNVASGQAMPAQVTITIGSLTSILVDVTPLIPQNSPAAALAASAAAAIQALARGK